ncbi:hypothetical protein BD408DRAFT_447316 [Parasitella parasitica]|nr:hypothetical protein BD408DRAFT_447316 [Parasitella parasitica]
MLRRVKTCYVCGNTDHLQASCPEAWWNIKKAAKKVAKLNASHKSLNQPTPTVTNIETIDTAKTSASYTELATTVLTIDADNQIEKAEEPIVDKETIAMSDTPTYKQIKKNLLFLIRAKRFLREGECLLRQKVLNTNTF